MARSLEETLAFHCAPALAGIKPANLISCSLSEYPALDEELGRLNRELNVCGIFFHPLCRCAGRVMLLVYRRKAMERHLSDQRICAYLRREGYPAFSLDAALTTLQRRLEASGDFPHEMGIFLGYPPEDVEGFRRGGRCKLCGYWKVYGNEQRAKELFDRFTRCRENLCAKVRNGTSIIQLFRAA